MKFIKIKKGFTLIELIVVMAVIGVLVLLAIPKFMGYTEKAKFTRIISNTNELEKASERYYMDYQEWPRLSDEPYTAEELESYANEIYNKTGKIIELDPDGKYYNIDHDKLHRYVQKPKDEFKYILQNPIGEVFYLDKLTADGEKFIDTLKENNQSPSDEDNPGTTPEPEPEPVIFSGLAPEAFDKNSSTRVSVSTATITWTGDLTNRKLTIHGKNGADDINGKIFSMYFKIKDADGKVLSFKSLNGKESSSIQWGRWSSDLKYDTISSLIVPEGAKSIEITTEIRSGYIYDIYVEDNLILPSGVKNVTSTSTTTSIQLNWEHNDVDYDKAFIYKDGKIYKVVEGKSFLDSPLLANSEHTYQIYVLNKYGSLSKEVATYTTKTLDDGIRFRGLGPAAFDKNSNTSVSAGTATVTWDGDLTGKTLRIHGKASYDSNKGSVYAMYLKFKDANGNQLHQVTFSAGSSDPKFSQTIDVIVPEGAVKIEFSVNILSGTIFDIYVKE